MQLERIDHFVITAGDMAATIRFYVDGLGMTLERFGEGRLALRFGAQKINLHQAGAELQPHAGKPTVGGADFCLIAVTALADVMRDLEEKNIPLELGPSPRQ